MGSFALPMRQPILGPDEVNGHDGSSLRDGHRCFRRPGGGICALAGSRALHHRRGLADYPRILVVARDIFAQNARSNGTAVGTPRQGLADYGEREVEAGDIFL